MNEPVACAAAAHAAREGEHHPPVNYVAKFYWLVALTAVEVAVAIRVEGGPKLGLLAFLSCWKAGIVLNHFMHLRTERLALKLAMAFPLVLILILVTLFLVDGVWLDRSFTG